MSGIRPGDLIGAYQILRQIGRGGMGVVYQARHQLMNRIVALKAVYPVHASHAAEIHKRFRREIEAAARLSHENVLTVFDAGWSERSPYLVMEFVDGDNLADIVQTVGVLTPDESIRMVQQAARGLQEVHEHGIVHRDVKPHNMMVNARNVLQLLDFGICKLLTAGTQHFVSQRGPTRVRQPGMPTGGTSHSLVHDTHVPPAAGSVSPDPSTNVDSSGVGSTVRTVPRVPSLESPTEAKAASFAHRVLDNRALETVMPTLPPDSPNEDTRVLGTRGFMSPEQATDSRTVDFRADIFSLGATLYFLLNGRPIVGESPEGLRNWTPPLVLDEASLPHGLPEVYRRMVAFDRAERYGSMSQVLTALKSVGTKPKLFISYRRDDTLDATDRLYMSLLSSFGAANLFVDRNAIPPGVDFRLHLPDRIQWCDIMLVVIGDHWAGYEPAKRGSWKRRLDSSSDYVRFEIETAIRLRKRIIPVLVGRAGMPTVEDLPPSLQAVAYLQSREVRAGPDYERWMTRLADEIITHWRSAASQSG